MNTRTRNTIVGWLKAKVAELENEDKEDKYFAISHSRGMRPEIRGSFANEKQARDTVENYLKKEGYENAYVVKVIPPHEDPNPR